MQSIHPGSEWAFVVTDALEKVHPDRDPRPRDASIGLSALIGEPASFQLAMRTPLDAPFREITPVTVTLGGSAASLTSLSSVELVPVTFATFPGHDGGYERDDAGLYPDLLRPVTDGSVTPLIGHWRGVWFDVAAASAADAGVHTLEIAVTDAHGTELYRDEITVTLHDVALPALDMLNTHWFHADSIADYYGWEVFSEEHWAAIDAFLAKAAQMDVTSVLTPVWTPPLDTGIGTYRTAVQLIDVIAEGDGYRFGFERLHRWFELLRGHGIPGVEIAHLFTQWGAGFTPAIYVERDGVLSREFGWDVPATDPRYRRLLEQLLPALQVEIERSWPRERVIFHVSDEPHGEEAVRTYLAAREVVDDLLAGWRVIDAVYDRELYERGIVPIPVVATDLVGDYLDDRPEELWVYYCQGQNVKTANRFISMPSLRNRVFGHQLFAAKVSGFLHWGFNFYYTWHATRQIDPMHDTDAGGTLPAGDPFLVYPGEDGRPLESIRYKVFQQAMRDHRAMQALRDIAGHEAVLGLIDQDGTLAFDTFTYDPRHYLRVREQINAAIVSGGTA